MLVRNLLSTRIPLLRCCSSSAPCLFKVGDTLKLTRTFTNEDVMEYGKVTFDSNPLHFDSESARNAGFEDRLVHGMLVATLFPWIISSHFVSRMLLLDFCPLFTALQFFFWFLFFVFPIKEQVQHNKSN